MTYVSKNKRTGLYYLKSGSSGVEETKDLEKAYTHNELTIDEAKRYNNNKQAMYYCIPYNQELQELRKYKLQKIQNICF